MKICETSSHLLWKLHHRAVAHNSQQCHVLKVARKPVLSNSSQHIHRDYIVPSITYTAIPQPPSATSWAIPHHLIISTYQSIWLRIKDNLIRHDSTTSSKPWCGKHFWHKIGRELVRLDLPAWGATMTESPCENFENPLLVRRSAFSNFLQHLNHKHPKELQSAHKRSTSDL